MRKLALVALIGLAAQLVDGALGMAYGATSTSLLLSAVAVGASAGFLVGLGSEKIDFGFAGALLVGGLIAAPIAAWLVKMLPPRMLGAAVGGLIVLTNGRTLGEAIGLSGDQITTLTVIVAVLWAASVAVAIGAVRREAEPA